MASESQTSNEVSTALTTASPAGDQAQEDFGSVLEAYVVKTNPEQIDHIKEFMTDALKLECKKHDDAIQAAWDTIEKAMTTFNTNRDKLIEFMKREEGVPRTQKAIESGALDKIVPQAYRKIIDEMMATSYGANDQPLPASQKSQSPALLPANPPGASNSSIPSSTSSAVGTTASAPSTVPAVVKPVKFTAKRSRPEPPPPSLPASAKRGKIEVVLPRSPTPSSSSNKATPPPFSATMVNRIVSDWSVEGREFIFPWTKGSGDFFVLRCGGEKTVPTHEFRVDPWSSREGRPCAAVDHYCHHKRCRGGHNGVKIYSPDEIVKRWGYRVTGPGVNEDWVNAANERLKESEERKEAILSSSPTRPPSWVSSTRS